MRIGVLLHTQSSTDQPDHFISKPLSLKFLAHWHDGKKACERVSDGVIRIAVNVQFGKMKALLKPGPKAVPRILPPRQPDWFFTSYPIADQRSL